MSATMTWTVQWMQCKPTEGSYTDVVVTVGWICQGQELVNNASFNANQYGSTSVPAPEGSFTPYADLTQDQVLGWIWADGVNKAEVEAAVQEQIDRLINPPVVDLPLPWPTSTPIQP